MVKAMESECVDFGHVFLFFLMLIIYRVLLFSVSVSIHCAFLLSKLHAKASWDLRLEHKQSPAITKGACCHRLPAFSSPASQFEV